MPQKQPPATTAVCSALVVANVASTAGFGTVALGRSPALQATTPTRVTIQSTADTREGKLLITNSFERPAVDSERLFNNSRVGSRTKVTRDASSRLRRGTSSGSAHRESNPAAMLRRRGWAPAWFF